MAEVCLRVLVSDSFLNIIIVIAEARGLLHS